MSEEGRKVSSSFDYGFMYTHSGFVYHKRCCQLFVSTMSLDQMKEHAARCDA